MNDFGANFLRAIDGMTVGLWPLARHVLLRFELVRLLRFIDFWGHKAIPSGLEFRIYL